MTEASRKLPFCWSLLSRSMTVGISLPPGGRPATVQLPFHPGCLHSAQHRDVWWVGCLPDRSFHFLRVGRLADAFKLQRGNKRASHCGQSVHTGQNACRFYLVEKNKWLFCSLVFSYPGSPWRVLLNITTCGRLQTDTYSRWTCCCPSNMY